MNPIDPKLERLRQQIGELAWEERLEAARNREAMILAVRRHLEEGKTLKAAIQSVGFSHSRFRQWIVRYTANGLLGLVDRSGKLAAFDQADPPTPNRGRRSSKTKKALSFVKWVGGKQSVLRQLRARIPRQFSRYFEPMVGSGALFFSFRPEHAVLSDTNSELMLTYEVIRDNVEELLLALGRHQNSREHYYRVRAQNAKTLPPIEIAARFIYLNKTCFNGLYRVNSNGHFNVPYGRDERANYRDAETLRRLSGQLRGVTLRCCDFAEACSQAAPGDFVYLDPPYLPRSSQRLIRYCSQGFSQEEHRRLAALVREMGERGCLVMVSNSNLPLIHKLYRGCRIEVLELNRSVNATASERRGWKEVLIRNFDLEGESRRGRPRSRADANQLPLLLERSAGNAWGRRLVSSLEHRPSLR